MIGAIIGDIVGSRFEFDNTDELGFEFFHEDCDFTDDTICTVAVADAIMNSKNYQDAIRDWCRRYPNPMGAYGSYFLNWIFRSDPAPYNSYGNGSAMRVSPIAWLFNSEGKVLEEAEKSATITHNHPEGIKGARAIAAAIFRMRVAEVKSPDIFMETAREFYGRNFLDNLPERGFFDVTCHGCVPLSLKIAADAKSFGDAIRMAVLYGGDTDTVGAIVGSLSEARFGVPDDLKNLAMKYLPQEMINIVEEFEKRIR